MHDTRIARWTLLCRLFILGGLALGPAGGLLSGRVDGADFASPWKRHTIDASARGADGVRLADVNGDGLPDITTGWEEAGLVRVCLNPGPGAVRETWPAVTVGAAAAVEDAVWVDLDHDGQMDVISSCEGRERSLYVHWAPAHRARYLDPAAWTTAELPASRGLMQWMFCLPLQVDGRAGVDLVAGGKNDQARIGWWQSPSNPRNLAAWRWHPIADAGWIMSLVGADMDADGDPDVVVTDRKGEGRGCFWLENPAPTAAPDGPWKMHQVGGQGREVMFLKVADLDRDGLEDVLVAAKPRDILFLRRRSREGGEWSQSVIRMPSEAGTAKAVNCADINQDGQPDVVFTCEGASGGRQGVMWLSYRESPFESDWTAHPISGVDGVKYDLVELLDLDADGDLDLLTCEEARNLGVIWYENPLR